MKERSWLAVVLLAGMIESVGSASAAAQVCRSAECGDSLLSPVAGQAVENPPFGPPLSGSGDVRRTLLMRTLLMGTAAPLTPVDDRAGFGIPQEAAEPTEAFEGTLTLKPTASSGNFTLLAEIFGLVSEADSPWKHLPTIEI